MLFLLLSTFGLSRSVIDKHMKIGLMEEKKKKKKKGEDLSTKFSSREVCKPLQGVSREHSFTTKENEQNPFFSTI